MANPKKAIARRSKGKLKPQPGREFICLIGGPCDTFNGWIGYGEKKGTDESLWMPGAPPRSRGDIKRYINFAPMPVDIEAKPKSEWGKYGWSEEAVKRLKKLKCKGTQLETYKTETHDLYWGNFVTPAARLYSSSSAWKAPLQRPLPKPGDIVTFLVYITPYEWREQKDSAASPHNPDHRTKPDAAKYWKSSYGSSGSAPKSKPSTRYRGSQDDQKREAKRKAADAAAMKADPHRPLSDDDINFHILMRTTSENTPEYLKRPTRYDTYIQRLYTDLLQSVQKRGVMTKLLFIRDPAEIVSYISTGQWSGPPLDSYNRGINWDNMTDEEADAIAETEDQNYGFTPPRPQKKDPSGRPLKWTLPWYKLWNDAPSVNRQKVKVARFDFIGHSEPWSLMLDYGWGNKKGEMPGGDVGVGWKDLDKAFDKGSVLTPDAHAMLWGCSLADTDDPNHSLKGGWAEYLNTYFHTVVAAKAKTDFTKIIHNTTNMPTPNDGVWSEFK
jgi:hypothetical protein